MLETGAQFSPCRTWRYTLWRTWDNKKNGKVMFIGLNPSTADETENDPTVAKCIRYAKAWGFSGMVMTNIFAYRATKPKDMKAFDDPIGPENDYWLMDVYVNTELAVACWGADGAHLERGEHVKQMLGKLKCLAITKHGHPWHPLYLKGDLTPMDYYGYPAHLNTITKNTLGKDEE